MNNWRKKRKGRDGRDERDGVTIVTREQQPSRPFWPLRPYLGCSRSKVWCSTLTASSMYFSSITTVILISEVEIIWMLMPSSASVRNILLATPTCERMPTPTSPTLQILSSPMTSRAPHRLAERVSAA